MTDRKKDHIELAAQAQALKQDKRFFYEPALGVHSQVIEPVSFLGKSLKAPLWISSMTGGTQQARELNQRFARACQQFGLGLGLGSCRPLLAENPPWEDFAVRKWLGDQPLLANLGLAQVEELLQHKQAARMTELLKRLEANGLMVHLNPLQEFFQPEGDRYHRPAVEVLKELLEQVDFPVLVKEVGQGMGPKSLQALLELPLAGLELGAYGGTNFSQVELLRSQKENPLASVGQTAEEMVDILRAMPHLAHNKIIIVSGGVRSFLDGYYYCEVLKSQGLSAIWGQGHAFLQQALLSYEALSEYIEQQINGYQMAQAFLAVRSLL